MRLHILKTASKRATVIGVVAATAALVAGPLGVAQAAVAAVPNNSVNSAKIVNNSIQSIDIRNNSVAGVDIKNASVAGIDITDGTVTGADIAFNTVTGADIEDETVASTDILDESITNSDIANGSIVRTDLAVGLLPQWAHVAGGSSPGIVDSRGVNSVSRPGVGVYQVAFANDIADCAWTATRTGGAVGEINGGVPATPGFITAELGNSDAHLVVRTFDTTGAVADVPEGGGFSVDVSC